VARGAYEGGRERKSSFVAGAVVEGVVHGWVISCTYAS
jgi:hypothetical protein